MRSIGAGIVFGWLLLGTVPAQAAWDCASDCWAETRNCSGLTECAKTYAGCLAYKAATCAVQSVKPEALTHGNYCGTGGAVEQAPIDALDVACRRHDDCYAARGEDDCRCDREFVTEVTGLAMSGDLPAGTAKQAAIITAYYGARIQTCPAE